MAGQTYVVNSDMSIVGSRRRSLKVRFHESCVSGLLNFENDLTHGQTGSTIHRSRPPADRSAWQAERGSRPTRATCSSHPREDVSRVGRVDDYDEDVVRMLRGCYEETDPRGISI